MILTVTPGSAIDRVIFIDEFLPGQTMRTHHFLDCVGGKGTDASVVLRALGADTLAMGFVAGERGHHFLRLLEDHDVQHDCVWCEGETRMAHVLVETRHHRHSHITTGALCVPQAAQIEFCRRYEEHLRNATWIAAGGSLPTGLRSSFYGDLVETARRAAVPALIDSYGEPMRQAVKARPAIVKMNRHELAETFGLACTTRADTLAAAHELRTEYGLPTIVVTCGGEGILAVTSSAAYMAQSPRQNEVNAAGAGDAVTAALTWRLSLREPLNEALRWAVAAAAAVVMTEGTAECDLATVQRLHSTVSVQSL